jgi:hypothetical protein
VAVGYLFYNIWLFLFTCLEVYVEVEVFVLGCGAISMGNECVRFSKRCAVLIFRGERSMKNVRTGGQDIQ